MNNYITLHYITLNCTEGGSGGNVENSAATVPPSVGVASVEFKDPFRHVETWAHSAKEGLLDLSDLDLLRRFARIGREELRQALAGVEADSGVAALYPRLASRDDESEGRAQHG